MTLEYNNVYLKSFASVAGIDEKKGSFGKFFDKTYDDFYMGEKTFEQAEMKMINESSKIVFDKSNMKKEEIDLLISGDLSNQIAISSYSSLIYNKPYLGIYSACASFCEGVIIASSFLQNKKINNVLLNISSHNLTAERQFRNPVEYGFPKPKRSTYTSTGAASFILSNEKSNIKIVSQTIGKTCDMNIKDYYDMGSVMAISCADTINNHLKNTNTKEDDYDLILSGDLGFYGSNILKEYLKNEYNISLKSNYKDASTIIYDREIQKHVNAGGSGPVCICLVFCTYVMNLIKEKKIKKILLVATGALMSPTMNNQKLSVPSISHAISIEVI